MLYFVVVALLVMIGGTCAFVLRRNELRRQEWRQESRAAWIKN